MVKARAAARDPRAPRADDRAVRASAIHHNYLGISALPTTAERPLRSITLGYMARTRGKEE
jgi:hypothetical protein